MDRQDIQTIGVVGGGLIGMSWASLFLAHGLDVVVFDPRAEARAELDAFLDQAWPTLVDLGQAKSPKPRAARVTTDLADLADVDFIQENTPDRIDIKRQTIAGLEEGIASGVIIASSTSSLTASDIQAGATNPGRVLVAHPMNPPHVVPLVELVAGDQTDEAHMATAKAFYDGLDRMTIRVRKEVTGHIANRLSAALYREAVHLVAEGIADVADIDAVMTYGPGMRWAFLGPHLTYHLGGGAGGYRHYLDHLGPTQEVRWKELGNPSLTDEVKARLVAGVDRELDIAEPDTLVDRRDRALVDLLALKRKYRL